MVADGAASETVGHDAITLELAKKESAEHLAGNGQLFEHMRLKPLLVRAYSMDDPDGPDATEDGVKVVHFVRHGQGFHNLLADMAQAEGREWVQYSKGPENPYVAPEILDAPLTDKGRTQALALQPRVRAFQDPPELVVLSSHCRALQTGLLAFEHLLPSVPFIAHEDVRECTGVHVCDKRRPKSRQEKEFPLVDFSHIGSEDDNLFLDDRRETKMEVGERIYNFLDWLSKRPEKHVGVASHSGWLMTVFNGIVECDNLLKPWFQTGEMRSVKLVMERKE